MYCSLINPPCTLTNPGFVGVSKLPGTGRSGNQQVKGEREDMLSQNKEVVPENDTQPDSDCYFLTDQAPCAPAVIPEECSAENNSVTIAWQPPPTSYVEGYVLELDDGNGGEFRVSDDLQVGVHLVAIDTESPPE
uniref:Fibronectin type-III domain-containing protein n=1 Tax=Timema genevievae TaxID=629358 RepID=A0A7R9JTN3_TIMGE|nr:unnamed protein product [Timema genevievae]